jgi:hypothetical protein
MSLYVFENGFVGTVIRDLQLICPDPGLAFEIGTQFTSRDGVEVLLRGSGKVTYVPVRPASTVGCHLIEALIKCSALILIRGERAEYKLSQTQILYEVSGGVITDAEYPSAREMHVIYDATNCNGSGYYVFDINTKKIPQPTHVTLFHELSHAYLVCTGEYSLPKGASEEFDTIKLESDYRATINLPARFTHFGGCNSPPPKPPTPPPPAPPPKASGCFIATAAYGSAIEPEVEFLRRFRDDVLRRTRAGEQFFDQYWEHYYRVSPVIVEMMRADPNVKELVRWSVVSPIVKHLQLLLRFPDAPVEDVAEPWRSFLLETRESLEEWTKAIELPFDFGGLPASAAAEEISIMMRYLLRTEGTRTAYLRRLEELDQIPLRVEPQERDGLAERLRDAGRSEGEIARILGGPAPARATRRRLKMRNSFGSDHIQEASIDPNEWFYTVTITNRTEDTFDEISLFYKRKDLPGVVFLTEPIVSPGESVVFRLGVCRQMESYVFGGFIGATEVFKLPEVGVMTPQLASQIKSSDIEPCADSWAITY